MLARACSRWPRALCRFERLLSERARSGRKASGRAAARSRWRRTASSLLARACSRWPRALCRFERLLSERARSGAEGVGAGGGEIAIEVDGFFDAGEGLLALAQGALPVRKVHK